MNIIDSHALQAAGLHDALRLAGHSVKRGPSVQAGTADPLTPSHFTFGADSLDRALQGDRPVAGLPVAHLHEIYAAEPEDRSSAAALSLLVAERARRAAMPDQRAAAAAAPPPPIVWISEAARARQQGRLYPPGLVELGLNPDHILHIDAADAVSVLRAAADAVRSTAVGAVIAELSGKAPKGLDLTATRRLALSAQKSGTIALLVRSQASALPSAAFSRWEVAAAPSIALAANAVGYPTFTVSLLRHRRGLTGLTHNLEWNRATQRFQDAPDIGARPAVPGIGADHETEYRRA